MKKTIALLIILVVVAGCNKKKYYESDITGTWKVYKYTVRGGDKSSLYNDYNIFFDGGKYSELHVINDTTSTLIGSGAYNFERDGDVLVLSDTTLELADTVWVPHVEQNKYTVYNLTSVHVQLRNDTSELYMEKLK